MSLLEHLRHCIPMAHAPLDHLGQLAHARSHNGVAHHHRQAAILRAAHGPELKPIAAEGEGRRAVPVLHVRLDVLRGAAARGLLLLLRLVAQQVGAQNDAVHVLLEALSRVEADDGRRSLLGSEAVVVARRGHGAAHQLVILRQAVGEARDARHEELLSLFRLAGVEEVQAGIRTCSSGRAPEAGA